MMVVYSFLAGAAIIPLTPILYIKSIANGIFIIFSQISEEYAGQKMVQLFSSVFLGPVIISFSLMIDLMSLPNILLKDARDFEHKY
jgi:hypothetical protein